MDIDPPETPAPAAAAAAAAEIPQNIAEAAVESKDALAMLKIRLARKYKDGTLLWADWRREKKAWRTYFVPIKYRDDQRNKGKPHACLKCTNELNLGCTGNGQKHLNKKHADWKTAAFALHASSTEAASGPLERAFAAARAADERSEEQQERAAVQRRYMSRLPSATPQQRALVLQLLSTLCTNHLLPYSFIEWPALVQLVETCLALPAIRVSLRCIADRHFLTVLPLLCRWSSQPATR